MAEINGDVKTRQRDTTNDLVDMAEFGFFGTHKLASGGGVVEQIQHFQRGTDRMRRGFNRHIHVASFGVCLPGFLLFSGTRGQRQAGNRTNTGERLAAKAEADNRFKIVQRGNFTGGMTRQRQRQLVFFYPTAVIANADKFRPAAFDININAGSSRIEAVFHQFLHHRCRTFHHLTGGDLVRKLRR